jgi:hypothetical protein
LHELLLLRRASAGERLHGPREGERTRTRHAIASIAQQIGAALSRVNTTAGNHHAGTNIARARAEGQGAQRQEQTSAASWKYFLAKGTSGALSASLPF